MEEACPLPTPKGAHEAEVVKRLLGSRRVAVVGLSDDPMRASHRIGEYLISHGYEVVPVNPKLGEVLGLKCYPSLRDVPGKVDLVDVFRRSEYCEAVVEDAIAAGAKGVWLQAGIRNERARKKAEDAGLDFVQDRCIMVEHLRR